MATHEPAHIFVTHKGPVKLTTRLYGVITQDRMNRAYAEAKHRAEQLQPYFEDRASRQLRYVPDSTDYDNE